MFIILTDWLQRIILKKAITTATLHFAYLCDTDAENKTAHWNVTVRHNICITWTLAINISTPNLIVTQLLTTPTPLTILHDKKVNSYLTYNISCQCRLPLLNLMCLQNEGEPQISAYAISVESIHVHIMNRNLDSWHLYQCATSRRPTWTSSN